MFLRLYAMYLKENLPVIIVLDPIYLINKTLWERTLRRRGCGFIVNAEE